MRKTRTQKGITLVALIITIVVLLILAVVAITAIQNNSIMEQAQSGANKYGEAGEKEHIMLTINEWAIAKYTQAGTSFVEFLGREFGASNVVDNGDGTVTITTEKGNMYKVKEDGTITVEKGVSITATGMPLILEEGATVTGTLEAVLVGITGEITWSNEKDAVATISGTIGESITVTAVAKGETKVTASCSGYTAEYVVKVKNAIEVGAYVEYDVSYTDMYQGTTFTSANGWRYLGEEAGTGNKLLISTGIPMTLRYSYKDAGEKAKWWDATKTFRNEQATSGLIKNFDKIPYNQKASGTDLMGDNAAIGRFEPSIKTYDGEEYNAVGDYFKVTGKTYSNNIIVRTLTLAELNRAVNGAMEGESGYTERAEDATSAGLKDIPEGNAAYGLFDMKKLTGYTANYKYWLATPLRGNIYSEVYLISYSNQNIPCYAGSVGGVRPVIVIQSEVKLKDTDGDEVFEIE